MKDYMKEMYRAYLIGIYKKNVDNIYIKRIAQEEYCSDTKVPHFAPHDGVCWRCKKQIYEGISLIQAANSLITGCPYCHRSYCD